MPAIIPFIPAIIGGVASLAGGALAGRNKSSTAPTMDPAYSGIQSQVLNMVQRRLQSPTGLPGGYETGGITDINQTYDLANQSRENAISARGLSRSPIAATADLMASNARAGEIGRFRSSLPLVARQLQNQDLAQATQVLGMGRGQATTGSSGGGAAGGAENLAAYLGYLMASGKLKAGGGTDPYAGVPGGFATVGTSY